jgi:hypothetical protein
MLKRAVAYILFITHLAMIILPHLPVILYVCNYGISTSYVVVTEVLNPNTPQTGDLAYLQAIYKRAGETNEQTEKQSQPERIDVPGFTFFILFQESLTFTPPVCDNSKYFCNSDKLPQAFSKIPSPPPKFPLIYS